MSAARRVLILAVKGMRLEHKGSKEQLRDAVKRNDWNDVLYWARKLKESARLIELGLSQLRKLKLTKGPT
jgi:hypothetical protein